MAKERPSGAAVMTSPHLGFRRWPALLVASALLLAGCDWPMLGFGPARTGYNPTETAITAANVGQLREAWKTTVGSAPPVVAGGKLFVVNQGFVEGGTPGYVRAFDAA